MNPINNPFSPGAGAPPPELVGRDPILEQARILLGRIRQRRPEKSLLLTGLRGVGKTVLLNEIERLAKAGGYHTIPIEAHEDKALGPLVAPHLRSLLFELDRISGAGDKAKRGLRVLRSFLSALKVTYKDVTIGLDIDPEQGSADSGDLEIDLPNLFVAVAEAAEERQSAVAVLIDEVGHDLQPSAWRPGVHRALVRRVHGSGNSRVQTIVGVADRSPHPPPSRLDGARDLWPGRAGPNL